VTISAVAAADVQVKIALTANSQKMIFAIPSFSKKSPAVMN
jgi:hypothetical protein